jgi:hypothetical protein
MITPYHAANGVTIYCADNRAVSWPDADLVYYLSHHRPRRGGNGEALPMFEGTDL